MLIDWFTVGAQAINFLILVWLLKRFLYRPVLAAIDAREQKIAGELTQAAAAQAQADKERQELRAQNEALQEKRDELLRAATAAANSQREQLLVEARGQLQELRSKSLAALEAEQAGLKLAVASRARQEAFALTRQTLKDLADTRLEDQMLEVFIRRLSDLKADQQGQIIPPSAEAAVLRSAFELTSTQRANIAAAFSRRSSPGATLKFEIAPELINGLELIVAGQKVAWNAQAYVAAIEERTESLLAASASAQD